jgi:hypothetical protein
MKTIYWYQNGMLLNVNDVEDDIEGFDEDMNTIVKSETGEEQLVTTHHKILIDGPKVDINGTVYEVTTAPKPGH